MKNTFLILAMGIMATGCSLDDNTINAACTPPFAVRIYEGGRPTGALMITNDVQLIGDIQTWLKSNPKEWRTSFVTYAPGIEIRNDSMTLNFSGGVAVLNAKDLGKQFIKKVDTAEIKFLKAIKDKAEPNIGVDSLPPQR